MALWGTSKSGIKAVSLTTGGSGYTAAPTVVFTPVGTGGTGAAATAVMTSDGDKIANIKLTAAGSLYTAAPVVSFTPAGTGGTGAAAVASWPGIPVGLNATGATPNTNDMIGVTAGQKAASDSFQHAGWAWTKTQTGYVTSVSVTTGGSGYTAAPSITFTGPTAGGAAASAVFSYKVASVGMTAGGVGTGYTAAPAVSFVPAGTGGTSAAATARISTGARVLATGAVTKVTLDFNSGVGGSGYTAATTVLFTPVGTGGTGAAATATITNGAITYVTVTAEGSGYTAAPAVSFTGSSGTGAAYIASIVAGTVSLATGSVIETTLTNQGYGYTATPTVSFTPVGTGGSSAAATAVITGIVQSITLTAPGAGYTAAPTIIITPVGTGGTGAAGTVNASESVGRIKSETLVAMGSIVA
jgi:hypothetical protein